MNAYNRNGCTHFHCVSSSEHISFSRSYSKAVSSLKSKISPITESLFSAVSSYTCIDRSPFNAIAVSKYHAVPKLHTFANISFIHIHPSGNLTTKLFCDTFFLLSWFSILKTFKFKAKKIIHP